MTKILRKLKIGGGNFLLKLPFFKKYRNSIFRMMGANLASTSRISGFTFIGEHRFLHMDEHSEINSGCFVVAKSNIYIGENSTLAYQVSLFTSAYPNGPYNKLSLIYPKVRDDIVIGKNVWIGARAIILPGVHIGDFSVVAAGSVVTEDIPPNVMVAGVPAKIKKELKETNENNYSLR